MPAAHAIPKIIIIIFVIKLWHIILFIHLMREFLSDR